MDEKEKQKHKCFGCIWGKDVGTHFFCPWQECKKEDEIAKREVLRKKNSKDWRDRL